MYRMHYSSVFVKNHSAPTFQSVGVGSGTMKTNRPKTTQTLIDNVRSLMRAFPMTKPELAKRSGISERMIAYILAGERTPTVEVANDLAKAFGLNGWQLLVPGLSMELAKVGKLEVLVKNYMNSSESGRDYIDSVAEREAEYRAKTK